MINADEYITKESNGYSNKLDKKAEHFVRQYCEEVKLTAKEQEQLKKLYVRQRTYENENECKCK